MTSYNIDWQSGGDEGIPGKEDIVLPSKTINTTATSLALTGKGVPNYGEIQQENFLRIMEHFASGTPPANPTIGQLWYNTVENILYMQVDPVVVGELYPRYYPQSPAKWIQIWPARNVLASINEFNAMAISINRIIAAPQVDGTAPDVADNQWGWGQIDLVPEYTSTNQLAPGFNPTIYPPVFDNTSWAILLSRLRKILRHLGHAETLVSPVGFIDDGRPVSPGNELANSYNDFGGAGTLPNYSAGWGMSGTLAVQMYYAATIAAINTAETTRFNLDLFTSSSMQTVTESTYSTPWPSTVSHTIAVIFNTEHDAKSYFNSGGYLQFNAEIDGGSGSLNTSWQNFLNDEINGLIFDHKGVRKNTTYQTVPPSGQSLGFYDLTNTLTVIFTKNRLANPYTISDGGYQLEAKATAGTNYIIEFIITFSESDDSTNFVNGILTSGITSIKAGAANVNAPIILHPAGVASNIAPGGSLVIFGAGGSGTTGTGDLVPIITSHPTNLAVQTGTSANFSVSATGGSLTYAWHKSTVGPGGPWTLIVGATSNTYGFTTAGGDNNTYYRATVSNTQGSAVSNPAQLTVSAGAGGGWAQYVNNAQNFTQLATNPSTGTVVALGKSGPSGNTHRLFYSTDNGSTWTEQSSLTIGTVSQLTFTDNNFYAVGTELWRSFDGVNWTVLPTPTITGNKKSISAAAGGKLFLISQTNQLIEIQQQNGETVWHNQITQYFYESVNAAASWSSSQPGPFTAGFSDSNDTWLIGQIGGQTYVSNLLFSFSTGGPGNGEQGKLYRLNNINSATLLNATSLGGAKIAVNGATLSAPAANNGQLVLSTNGGATFNTSSPGYDFAYLPYYFKGMATNGSATIQVGSTKAVTSTDLTSWTTINTGTSVPLNDVVWNGTKFIIAGNGVILTSQ